MRGDAQGRDMTALLDAYVAQIVHARKELAARMTAASGSESLVPAPALFVNDDPVEMVGGRSRHSHFSHRGATLSPGQYQVRLGCRRGSQRGSQRV